MAVQLTPLGKVVIGTLKWVAVPLLAALIGYQFIGPRIGGGSEKPVKNESRNVPKSEHGKKFQEIRENDH